jgi:hypothetical protein
VKSITALVQRPLPPHRPPLLPHALNQLPRRLEGRQQTPGTLRTGALQQLLPLLALRQLVLVAMDQRQNNNAVTSELRLQLLRPNRHMNATLQQMARRVLNATPIRASKETGRLQVNRTGLTGVIVLRRLMVRALSATPMTASKETGRLQVTRTSLTGVIALRRLMVRAFNATPISASKETGRLMVWALNAIPVSANKFKETGQPLAQVSVISKLALPRTPQILPTLPRGDILPHRVALVFKATPMYASTETGMPRVIVTRLRKFALPQTPQIP